MLNKPKIAIIISHPIQHFCPQYVSYAQSNDWKIKVFFASSVGINDYEDKDFKETISWQNLCIDQFSHEFLNDRKAVTINSKIDAPDLNKRLDDLNPDVIIIYGYRQKLQRRTYLWAIKKNKKIIYISDSENNHRVSLAKIFAKALFLIKYFKKIDAFLTVGDANEAYYKCYKVPQNKMFRTFFPIDRVLFAQSYEKKDNLAANLRNELKITNNEIVCTVVGKLVRHKCQADILLALSKIRDTTINIVLLIIGSGLMLSKLKKQAYMLNNKRVIFTGFVKPEQLPKYYSITDIYIHPAKYEPHSLAISEAIYMGCPVIVSDRCGSYGQTDDVQPGKNGLVYKQGDTKELSECIKTLIIQPELRRRMAENSHKIGETHQQLAHNIGLFNALKSIGLL
jgi:glycosyltransferase involved in cell wall biosynthesis